MLAQIREQQSLITTPRHFPAGEVVAFEVTAEVYLRDYADYFYEWVKGVVVKMPPVTARHDRLTNFFRMLLEAYFDFKPIGEVYSAPFVMRLENSRREPDLQVILATNKGTLYDTYMDGAADICIEVVSPSNSSVDYGDKFVEYESAGVQEYWLIDPMRKEVHFYRLTDEGHYKQIQLIEGIYRTPLLPRLNITVATLWEEALPKLSMIMAQVKRMLEDEA